MKDLIVILMTFGFFGLCVAYVALCDRIIGPDPDPEPVIDAAARSADTRSAATDRHAVTTTVGSAR